MSIVLMRCVDFGIAVLLVPPDETAEEQAQDKVCCDGPLGLMGSRRIRFYTRQGYGQEERREGNKKWSNS